ncbi:MAG: response regulator transcription factor [Candidatus Eremiobacteraeota bacterium]|nr:response regulator transcription factor [Candidatus Eremiobacteraeota bacterium]
MRLLVIEDDPRLNDVLRRGLTEQGHVVDVALDGVDGERCAAAGVYDAIVLDINLPLRDGLSVVRSLRRQKVRTPVLLLTSRDTTEDIVEGLDAGADDYLRKPFIFAELEARLRTITRRGPQLSLAKSLDSHGVTFDLASRQAARDGRQLDLTARETAFLEYFLRNSRRLVTRRMIEDDLFDRQSESTSNVVDVYVSRLRAKLTAAGERQLLHTVRGSGYRLGDA